MSDAEKGLLMEDIADKVADKVADKMMERFKDMSPCRCGLQDDRIKEHDEHHRFVGDVIDMLHTAKKSVFLTTLTALILGIFGLIWLGFRAKLQ